MMAVSPQAKVLLNIRAGLHRSTELSVITTQKATLLYPSPRLTSAASDVLPSSLARGSYPGADGHTALVTPVPRRT